MKIELNKKLDKEVYLAFNDAKVGGVDFGKIITNSHPKINSRNYDKYIDDFYIENNLELQNTLEETIRCFNGIEKPLFDELKRCFGKDYSKEEYICYLSIFDCNPRYIETKTFQVFYKRPCNLRKEVIAHETTHFAFYDYCFGLGIKDSKELWELLEIFNVIFLNIPALQKVIGVEELLFYPNLKDKLEVVKKIWSENSGIKEFILKSMDYLESRV